MGASFKARHGSRQLLLASQAAARRQAEQKQQQSLNSPTISSSISSLPSYNVPSASSSSSGMGGLPTTRGPLSHSQLISSSYPNPVPPNVAASPASASNPSTHDLAHDNRPVCIGLLSSLVLMLYPVQEFQADALDPGHKLRAQTLPVRLRRFPPNGNNEMLKVLC